MFTVVFEIRDDILHAKVTGVISSAEQAVEKAVALVAKSYETGVYRLLVDERELTISIDALDIVQAVDAIDKRGIQGLGGRTACLYRPEYAAIYKNYETFYKNRSLIYQAFEDDALALEWLRA